MNEPHDGLDVVCFFAPTILLTLVCNVGINQDGPFTLVVGSIWLILVLINAVVMLSSRSRMVKSAAKFNLFGHLALFIGVAFLFGVTVWVGSGWGSDLSAKGAGLWRLI